MKWVFNLYEGWRLRKYRPKMELLAGNAIKDQYDLLFFWSILIILHIIVITLTFGSEKLFMIFLYMLSVITLPIIAWYIKTTLKRMALIKKSHLREYFIFRLQKKLWNYIIYNKPVNLIEECNSMEPGWESVFADSIMRDFIKLIETNLDKGFNKRRFLLLKLQFKRIEREGCF